MKETELRDKTDSDLANQLIEVRSDLARLKFKHSLGQLEKTADLKKLKKEIARINTIIKEKNAKAN